MKLSTEDWYLLPALGGLPGGGCNRLSEAGGSQRAVPALPRALPRRCRCRDALHPVSPVVTRSVTLATQRGDVAAIGSRRRAAGPAGSFVYSAPAVPRPALVACELSLCLILASCALACNGHGSPRPIGDARPAAACPSFLDLELIGADSRFDPGWTGNTHGVGLPTGSQTTVELECDAACRRCKFHGPVRGDPVLAPVINQRCLNDVSKVCAADADCGGVGPCRFVFPPIATKLANTCSLAYFEPVAGPDPSPVQGVIDLQTGQSDLPVLNMLIAISVESCANCLGDPKPFDGVAGGTCNTPTPRACDVNGIGTVMTGTTSYDCPPSPAQSTIVLGTSGTSTSSVTWTMDDNHPRCTASSVSGQRCWCGMCSNGAPCTANKDCPDRMCGSAQGPPPANNLWAVANNSCTGKCNWNATTQTGTCADNPALPCFPDSGSMIATGAAEVHDGFYITQLANLICLPSFNSGSFVGAAVDKLGGFPGPFRFQARFRVTTRSTP